MELIEEKNEEDSGDSSDAKIDEELKAFEGLGIDSEESLLGPNYRYGMVRCSFRSG